MDEPAQNLVAPARAMLESPVGKLPDTVHELEDGVLEVYDRLSVELPENSVVALRSDLLYWDAWLRIAYGVPLTVPVWAAFAGPESSPDELRRQSVRVVERFVEHHMIPGEMPIDLDEALIAAKRKKAPGLPSPATVQRRVSSFTSAHVNAPDGGYTSPASAPAVRERLKRLSKRRSENKPKTRKSQGVATADMVERMLDACPMTLQGIRDKALIALAFDSGGRRRSEPGRVLLADLERNSLVRDGEKRKMYLLTLPHTKTRSRDDVKKVAVAGKRAVDAIDEWLAASGIGDDPREHPLFRRIGRDANGVEKALPPLTRSLDVAGREIEETYGLTGKTVGRIVRRRAAAAAAKAEAEASADGDRRLAEIARELRNVSAHGLRAGFVTEALRRGNSIRDTMEFTDHKSVASLQAYWQGEEAKNNPVGGMLD